MTPTSLGWAELRRAGDELGMSGAVGCYGSMATGWAWFAQVPPIDLMRETLLFRRWAASWAEARSVASTVRWAAYSCARGYTSITSSTRLRQGFRLRSMSYDGQVGAARVHVAGIVAFLGEFSGMPGRSEGAFWRSLLARWVRL